MDNLRQPRLSRDQGHATDARRHRAHDCIAFERLYATDIWTFRKGAETVAIPFRPRFAVNTADGAIDAALSGAGIVRILSYQAADAIAAGRSQWSCRNSSRPPPRPARPHRPGHHAPEAESLRRFRDLADQGKVCRRGEAGSGRAEANPSRTSIIKRTYPAPSGSRSAGARDGDRKHQADDQVDMQMQPAEQGFNRIAER